MAGVYGQPTSGGADSARFKAYTAAAAAGVPVHGYNPMTSKPVGPTVDALIAVNAEARLATVANLTAARLSFDGDAVMQLTVATPGMWTDRLATEVEHRLLGADPGGVLWWFDEPVEPGLLDAAIVAQTVRLVSVLRAGPPPKLRDAVTQEGRALAMAGGTGRWDDRAADVLDVLADDPSLSSMVGFLYGDDAARALGFTPLGLGHHVGEQHAIALAGRSRVPAAAE